MCEVNWILLSGFIAALASAANALLLFWMIRVTRQYVDANVSLLEVSRGSLNELKRQYAALIEREVRPYKNLINRVVRNLEALGKRDLVSAFENRNGIGWLSAADLLPSDYEEVTKQAMTYDVELYEALRGAKAELLSRPTNLISEMETLARSGRSTLYPELPQLQAEFRTALIPMVALFSLIRDKL
jgi:hypothetical protein